MSHVKPSTMHTVDEYKNVVQFLNSKARNSANTTELYHVAVGYFETFLKQHDDGKYNIETIVLPLIKKKIDVYQLLDRFVGFLEKRNSNSNSNSNSNLSARSISLYVAGVRSYLEFFDIDIIPRKFKSRVVLPRAFKIKKKALDSQDIRTLLLACNDQRLKALICVLVSSGSRIMEILTLTNSDIELSETPTKIRIKGENTKTKQDRDILISQEAKEQLKMFLVQKYGSIEEFKRFPNHFLFANHKSRSEFVNPRKIYLVMHRNFKQLLKKVHMDTIRSGVRREINFHLLRSFFKSVVATQTNSDFSEYMLGHVHSTYWSIPEKQIKEMYLKCQKFLTFLDYNTVESVGRDFESKLEERDREFEKYKKEMEGREKEFETYKEEIIAIRGRQEKLDRLIEEARINPKHRTKNLLANIAKTKQE